MHLYSNKITKWQQRGLMLCLGFIQGLLLWLISENITGLKSKAMATGLQAFAFISIFFIQFIWNNKHKMSLILLVAFCAGVFSYTIYETYSQLYSDAGAQRGWNDGLGAGTGAYFILGALTLLIAPFLSLYHLRHDLRFPYGELMNSVWVMLILIFYATFFTSIMWGVLILWNKLFISIDIDSLSQLIDSSAWKYMFTLACFGYFLAVARQTNEKISFLYKSLSNLCGFVLPIASFTTLLFLALLLGTGLYSEIDLRFSIATTILILISVTIFLYNGSYNEFHGKNPYPKWVIIMIKSSILSLSILSILAILALDLRIEQYGLTIKRVWAIVVCLMALFLSVGYGASIILYKRSMVLVAPTNKYGAWLAIIILLLMHTPTLDPAIISAKNQYQRFIDEKISPYEFDYGYLEFELGNVGHEYIERIKTLQNPEQSHINKTIELIKSKTYYDWQRYLKQKKLVRDVGLGREVANKINYPFLYFSMKSAGKDLFTRLLRMEYHPQYHIIKHNIEIMKPYQTWEEWNQRTTPTTTPNPKDYKAWEFNWDD